jgi:hypothetical protein
MWSKSARDRLKAGSSAIPDDPARLRADLHDRHVRQLAEEVRLKFDSAVAPCSTALTFGLIYRFGFATAFFALPLMVAASRVPVLRAAQLP